MYLFHLWCVFMCIYTDTFTDSAISSSRVNGEHREKVLQRWDGDGNGENFELESDTVRNHIHTPACKH